MRSCYAFGMLALIAARPVVAEPYRAHVAAADGASVALLVAGATSDVKPLSYLGTAGLALGSAGVHAAHGNWGRATIALAMRGAPLLYAASIRGPACQDGTAAAAMGCINGGKVVAGLVFVAAVVVDYAVLAAGDDGGTTPAMLSVGGSF
ncbi:MAG: hypothetical protein R3B06_02955 [Kofleriaceae bacterium]